MKKVTITKKDGKIGIMTLADDGKWDISVDGNAAPKNYHYTTDQVEKIITTSRQNGESVTVE